MKADEYIQNAIFQWEDGERRLREADGPDRAALERAAGLVLSELHRRLGSTFFLEELADLYRSGTDWASDIGQAAGAGTDSVAAADAAFARYARESADYAGGRRRERIR